MQALAEQVHRRPGADAESAYKIPTKREEPLRLEGLLYLVAGDGFEPPTFRL